MFPIKAGINILGVINNLVTSLQGAGVPAASIPNILQGVMALSPKPAVDAILQTVLANAGNPDVVKAEAIKLSEVANVPASVAGLVPSLQAAAGNAMLVTQVVSAIEAAMSTTRGGSLLSLL